MKAFWLTVFVCCISTLLAVRSSSVQEDDPVQHLTRLRALLEDEGATFDEPSEDCAVQFRKIGCFKDKRKRHSLKKLLFNARSGIDWTNWGEVVKRTVCRCAKEAESRGFSYFGVQYYGECWSGAQQDRRYDMYGAATRDKCVGSSQSFEQCDDNSQDNCAGRQNANYVYEIVPGAGSGSGLSFN